MRDIYFLLGFKKPLTLILMACSDSPQIEQPQDLRCGDEVLEPPDSTLILKMDKLWEVSLRLWLAENDIIGAGANDAIGGFRENIGILLERTDDSRQTT